MVQQSEGFAMIRRFTRSGLALALVLSCQCAFGQFVSFSQSNSITFNVGTGAVVRLNDATGIGGGLPATGQYVPGTARNGWQVREYGSTSNTGFLRFNANSSNPVTISLISTLTQANGGVFDGSSSGVASNFNPFTSYEWVIFRPRTDANTASANNISPNVINSVANIELIDNGVTVATNSTNLRNIVSLDTAGWNWGSTPVGDRGFFHLNIVDFGGPTRGLSISYTPVPEPATILGLSALGFGLAGWRRTRRG